MKHGAEQEKDYTYTAMDDESKFDGGKVVAKVTGHHSIAQGSEEDLRSSVAEVGPVSVAIDASGSGFMFYSDGVYEDNMCSPENLDHGVLAVGYSATAQGKAYWIVKNSWGTSR